MFPRVILSVLIFVVASPIRAEEEAPLNPEATLFEASFGNDTEKFQKRCEKMHRIMVRPFGDKKANVINVTIFNERMKQFRDEGRLPAQLGHSQFLEHADSNKDNSVTSEEFCSAVEERMNAVKVKDLTNSNLEPETLAVVKKTVCTWKDRIPGFKSQICELVEDAQEKAEEKEKAETGQEVSISKREIKNKKKWVRAGAITLIVLGVLGSLETLGTLFTGPAAIILFPLSLAATVLFFILGNGLLKVADSM